MRKTIFIAAILTAAIFATSALADTNTGYVTVTCTQLSDCPTGYACVSGQCQTTRCGITASPTPHNYIDFGSMVQGTTLQSADTTIVTNTGNVQVSPLISGDYWYGTNYGTIGDYMPITATQWYVSGWNYLTSSPTSIGALSPSGTATVYYQLVVPAQQFTDSYSQTITYSASC